MDEYTDGVIMSLTWWRPSVRDVKKRGVSSSFPPSSYVFSCTTSAQRGVQSFGNHQSSTCGGLNHSLVKEPCTNLSAGKYYWRIGFNSWKSTRLDGGCLKTSDEIYRRTSTSSWSSTIPRCGTCRMRILMPNPSTTIHLSIRSSRNCLNKPKQKYQYQQQQNRSTSRSRSRSQTKKKRKTMSSTSISTHLC